MRDVLLAALAARRRDRARGAGLHRSGRLAALAFPDPAGRRWRSRFPGAIGAYHAGVELKIFEGVTTCAAPAARNRRSKTLMKVPLVRCDQVQWSFLGMSMAGWNAIISLSAAAAIIAC